jgi:NitT/TauT family transport system substrate-binding protein
MRLQLLTSKILFCLLVLLLNPLANGAALKPSFTVCWSPYAGWLAWDYAKQERIIDKWADKYGIDISIEKAPDSISAIEHYSAGKFDACAMTNVDALTIAASAGIDSTALIIGDFSAGADGIVMRGSAKGLRDLKGKTILMAQSPVARYLLNRALHVAHFSPSEVKIKTVAEQDLMQSFIDGQGDAVISRNPVLAEIKRRVDVSQVFSSKFIAGEIIDLMVVNSSTLTAHPELGKALTGAWYEVQQLLGSRSPEGKLARSKMANNAGTSAADFDLQLKTIRSFYIPRSALAFANSKKMPALMQRVADFTDGQQHSASQNSILSQLGISFSQRRVLGNPEQIMLRFDPTYMQLLADSQSADKPKLSLNQHLNQVTLLPSRATAQ